MYRFGFFVCFFLQLDGNSLDGKRLFFFVLPVDCIKISEVSIEVQMLRIH